MEIKIPEFALVVLVGTSGAGKSTFARTYFKPTEIVSSDVCRGLVSDDENNQLATTDAFELLHYIVEKRLKNGLLTVVDATNVQPESRKSLLKLARQYHCLPVVIVLDLPDRVCEDRNELRPDRNFGGHVIRQQRSQLKKSLRFLSKEGFRQVITLRTEEEINAVTGIFREKLFSNKKEETGPFDIIGDVHGCLSELKKLLQLLGYTIREMESAKYGYEVAPPEDRKAIFVGDLVDRGPDSPGVLKLVMSMVGSGAAYCVPGNHDMKLHKYLKGNQVQLNHGLDLTVAQLEGSTPEFLAELKEFLYALTSHLVLDEGRLVVAHAGLKEDMHGRASGEVRSFCLYGETTGETDEFGLPVRHNWAAEYRGKAMVVYGHTPVPEAEWLNGTIDIDTGCVFGGKLTALRYPEKECVSVQAEVQYCEPARPFLENEDAYQLSAQQENDDLLDLSDVSGKRYITTRLSRTVTIPEEKAIPALEVMSRFAVDPKWLIYLPPTMSPCEVSTLPEYLEYPLEALHYYRKLGVTQVVCEEKHMGSRVVIVVCRDTESAVKRFGVSGAQNGICYTRTGRPFFTDQALEKQFIERVTHNLTKSGFWERLQTDWVCLDAELMPWSAKAQSLIREQYAAVGAAAKGALPVVSQMLQAAANRGIEGIQSVSDKFKWKNEAIGAYVEAYRQYCWPVNTLDDYKLAPFHILATEGAVHTGKSHLWHMETLASCCSVDPEFMIATNYRVVNLDDAESCKQAVNWWLELTSNGGEGMVVKPMDFETVGQKGLVQPAIKCRGKEYLRIIYGPEYDLPENLERLKQRALSGKQSLAMREFALGIEALERFVKCEPLRRVHETVFGVLALESEALDPRL